MELKDRVFKARKTKGLSQEDLAEAVGVSRQAVSKWETGEAMPDMEKLIALCRVLELDIEYLALGKRPAPTAVTTKKPRKWLAALVAAVCLTAGIFIGAGIAAGHKELLDPPGILESVEIADITVTGDEGTGTITVSILPSQVPEGMYADVLWGQIDGAYTSVDACSFDGERYQATFRAHGVYYYRVRVRFTLGGEQREIPIVDIYGNESDVEDVEYKYLVKNLMNIED